MQKKESILKLSLGYLLMAFILSGVFASGALAGQAGVSQQGNVTVFTPQNANANSAIDFENAIPMPTPTVATTPLPSVLGTQSGSQGTPGVNAGSSGAAGNGDGNGNLPTPSSSALTAGSSSQTAAPITPQEYGTAGLPYTTMRVDLVSNHESSSYPYRAAGKLYFLIGTASYVCSASLIQPGLIVTAAHCVCNFGQSQFYSGWVFAPARFGTKNPYGTWGAAGAYVMTAYYNGTDVCSQAGVVCENDMAVLRLAPVNKKTFPGPKTGWLGYGWNGYGFINGFTQIAQLGYPVSHDSGLMMERNDAQGYTDSDYAYNTIFGSRMTGGASGGPFVVNIGISPVLNGTALGSASDPNIVVGVTSWATIDDTVKEMGGSPFTSSNIVSLVSAACTANPLACASSN